MTTNVQLINMVANGTGRNYTAIYRGIRDTTWKSPASEQVVEKENIYIYISLGKDPGVQNNDALYSNIAHRTFEPPKPVLCRIAPRLEEPSPRSSEDRAVLLLWPKIPLPPAGGARLNARSRSQSYARESCCSPCPRRLLNKCVPSPPRKAPVQKPGLHPSLALALGVGALLE
jgi:hypothetical protein